VAVITELALTLFVGWQEEHLAGKNSDKVLVLSEAKCK